MSLVPNQNKIGATEAIKMTELQAYVLAARAFSDDARVSRLRDDLYGIEGLVALGTGEPDNATGKWEFDLVPAAAADRLRSNAEWEPLIVARCFVDPGTGQCAILMGPNTEAGPHSATQS